jgi:hypothetical protein
MYIHSSMKTSAKTQDDQCTTVRRDHPRARSSRPLLRQLVSFPQSSGKETDGYASMASRVLSTGCSLKANHLCIFISAWTLANVMKGITVCWKLFLQLHYNMLLAVIPTLVVFNRPQAICSCGIFVSSIHLVQVFIEGRNFGLEVE